MTRTHHTHINADTPGQVPERDATRTVLVALRRIIRATDLHSRRISKATGLTVPQLVVLQAIRELGEVTTGRIAGEVSLSQATVTVIIDKLEERGLLTRYRSAVDRRVVHTALTPAGRRQLDRAPALLHDSFTSRFEALPEAHRRRIERSLSQVAAMMDAEDLDVAPLLDVGKVTRT
jgi:DNA-binding MarR family transcriptional regulator